MTRIWKLRSGDMRNKRNYAPLCLHNGIALLGADAASLLDPEACSESLDPYLEALRDAGWTGAAVRCPRAFWNDVHKGDVIVLVFGPHIQAVGHVLHDHCVSISLALAMGLGNVDGWTVPFAREVEWLVPHPDSDVLPHPRLSVDRFSQLHGWDEWVATALASWVPPERSLPWTTVCRTVPDRLSAQDGALLLGKAEPALRSNRFFTTHPNVREHEVVTHSVVPFLRFLGWDAPSQIAIEQRFVDVILFEDNDRELPFALIEAKRYWGTTVGSKEQVLGYARREPGASVIATTSGGRWSIWDSDGWLLSYCDLMDPAPLECHPLLAYATRGTTPAAGLQSVLSQLRRP